MSTASESFLSQKSSPWMQSAHANSQEWGQRVFQYAMTNPLKFVAVATFSLVSIVPVFAFLCFVAGTLVATLIAGVVWEILLLFIGMLGLAGALSVAFCLSTCVTCVAAVLYTVFQAARSSLNMAKTVTPVVFRKRGKPEDSSSSSPLPEELQY